MKLPLRFRINQPTLESPNIEWALWWASKGWPVFPLAIRDKVPFAGSDGLKSATTDEERIRLWWNQYPNANIGGRTDRRVVFDDDGGGLPVDEIEFPPTALYQTGSGGWHHVYAAAEGTLAAELSIGTKIFGKDSPHRTDIRAGAGGYIVLPGSTHPNGGKYEVHVWPEANLPDETVRQLLEYGARIKGSRMVAGGAARTASTGKTIRVVPRGATHLTELLATPPDEGGRNDWLTTVAGHYARQYRWSRDLYVTHVAQANERMAVPLSQNELEKTLESIWATEQREHPEREATSATGHLAKDPLAPRLQVSHLIKGPGDSVEVGLCDFADFHVEALGVHTVNDERELLVRLTVDRPDKPRTVTLVMRGSDFESRRLTTLLASYGASIAPVAQPIDLLAPGMRILRYLESQNPPALDLLPCYGWADSANGYVVPGGVVTAAGLVDVANVSGALADPARVKGAPYAYGFEGSAEEAAGILREVLTFQDPDVTSVYGAWWAAVLAKQWVLEYTGTFPFMAIDAASESGKTNGFFGLMHQLGGATNTGVVATFAAARNSAMQNSNGVVWIDDMDDTSRLHELLRASSSQGELTKSNVEHTGNASHKIVAAMQISGESLPYNQDKALRDRAIVVTPTNPTSRRSRHGDWLQWEDILALRRRFPIDKGGMAVLAGWFLARSAQAHHDGVIGAAYEKARSVKRKGRRGTSDELLIIGSHLLDYIVSEGETKEGGEHAERVLRWVRATQEGTGGDEFQNENALTLTILPEVLRVLDFPRQVELAEKPNLEGWTHTPALLAGREEVETLVSDDSATIDFHTPTLARFWKHLNRGQASERTATAESLAKQATAIGVSRTKKRVVGSDEILNYRRLTGPVAAAVLRRARGEDD